MKQPFAGNQLSSRHTKVQVSAQQTFADVFVEIHLGKTAPNRIFIAIVIFIRKFY